MYYLLIIVFTFLMGFLSFLQVHDFYGKITYNSLINPIFIFTPFYIGLFVMMRIGAYTYFVRRYFNIYVASAATRKE